MAKLVEQAGALEESVARSHLRNLLRSRLSGIEDYFFFLLGGREFLEFDWTVHVRLQREGSWRRA